MPLKIVILEDNQERKAAMASSLVDRFVQYETKFFHSSPSLISFLQDHLNEVIILSLDHDLEVVADKNGKLVDQGTGREVADFLAQLQPAFPVVIHSTNSGAAQGMEMVLREANWETYRVIPFGDLEWVPTQWFRAIRQAILSTARPSAGNIQ